MIFGILFAIDVGSNNYSANQTKMNINRFLSRPLVIACMISFAAGPLARAITITSSVGGAPTGVNIINFDNLALGNSGGVATGPNGSVNVSFTTGDGKVVTGASGQYAAPWLSGGNGIGFGAQANGADTTKYISTGIGSVTLDWGSANLNYFGILWGSVDAYNSLRFYNGNTLVDTVTGTNVWAGANGNQGVNGTQYVNINTSGTFNRVVAKSTSYAFEFDNVAYKAVPDSGSIVALFGGAMIALAAFRRRFGA